MRASCAEVRTQLRQAEQQAESDGEEAQICPELRRAFADAGAREEESWRMLGPADFEHDAGWQ